MNKILITGANGFVGSRFVQAMKHKYTLLTPSHQELDITNLQNIKRYFEINRPQKILHLAAISDTGYCETHPEESYSINVQGVENMATVAAYYDAQFIFFSSDQVYNGNIKKGLLEETLSLIPENHYGRHKLEAEKRTMQINENNIVLRATWMYDCQRENMPIHRNFVLNIENAIKENKNISFPTREYRGITWINEVINNIPYTFKLPGGIYNFGSENKLNTYETALAYISLLDKSINPNKIIIADNERFPLHIRNISISMHKAIEASNGAIHFSDTLNGLKKYKKSIVITT